MEIKHQRTGRFFLLLGFLVVFLPNFFGCCLSLSLFPVIQMCSIGTGDLREEFGWLLVHLLEM